jgi:S-DNA-T family DNA segregation ATPase FtsK/SpoIIIE
MPPERNVRLDLFALVLVALTVFLTLTLATYHPADPPAHLVYPAPAVPANACGKIGAWIAHVLFTSFGVGAYYLALSVGVLAGVVLQGRQVEQGWVRGAGWGLSLLGITTLAQMLLPSASPGPVIGSGGYVGALGRAFLESHFAATGSLILIVSMTGVGLLLCTDYVLLQISAMLFGPPVKQVGRGLAKGAGALAKRRGSTIVRSDVPDFDTDKPAPSIRIGGRKVADLVDDAEVEEGEAEKPAEVAVAAVAGAEASAPVQPPIPAGINDGPPVAPDGPRIKNKVVKQSERESMMAALDAAADKTEEQPDFELPPLELLVQGTAIDTEEQEKDVRKKAKILEKTFANFGFNVKVVEIETGPVIAQFEVELEAGLRLSKITSLADDLAIALRVPSVRIVAPIPGKNSVGIEVPNSARQVVALREVIEEANGKAQKMKIPIYLGKDVAGNPMLADLATLPHLLIAGRTGTGKSVCLNTLIMSMLMTRRPDELRMLLIDPKMVELSCYKTLPHLMHPVVTDMKKAEAILAWAVEKMEERYALLARAGVRHISGYNQLGDEELMERLQPENDEEKKNIPQHLPYIVIVADEMADLMMTAGKEVETHIIRLAQKSRAVGIHLVLATQKPTVDVITGLIKSNLPARIAFQVASRTDSRVVLDEMGADKLLGNGDMLFLWPGKSTLIRGQGTYVSDDEINKVVEFVGTTEPEFVKELVALKPAGAAGDEGDRERWKSRDELYEAAIDVVVREGRGSVSLLQRALGIGYGRGARLIDFMAEDGIVGTYNGSQAREVLVTVEQWEEMSGQKGSGGSSGGHSGGSSHSTAASVSSPRPKSNKIVPERDEEEPEFEEAEADDYDAAEEDADDESAETDDSEADWDDDSDDDAEYRHRTA